MYLILFIVLWFGIFCHFHLYLFTGKTSVAFGFMIISNIYTTLGYFFHERIWDNIKWGKVIYKKEG
jgi:uncharacterized membrane protein